MAMQSGKRDLALQSTGNRPTRVQVARAGETAAAIYLQKHGLRLLDCNWHSGRFGELDLVLRDASGLIVFVEVKTRRAPRQERDRQFCGLEDITWRKRRKLLIAARSYLTRNHIQHADSRMDVLVVYYSAACLSDDRAVLSGVQFLHVPGAFCEV